MKDNTIYILLLSFVQFNYKSSCSLKHVRQDIKNNNYFGDDTEVVLSQLETVWQDLVELEL